MSNILKNINSQEILSLAGQVEILKGQIVSKTLVQNAALSITLFAFDKGEELSTHESNGDAMVTVLEGTGLFTIDNEKYLVGQGQTIIMPSKKPHAVFAQDSFKMILTVVF